MKALLAHTDLSLYGEECRHCGRSIMQGQSILVTKMNDAPYGTRLFVLHKSCVEQVLVDAPPNQDEAAFLELKRKIHETKEAFPSV